MKQILLLGRIQVAACMACDLAVLCLGWILPKERIWSLLDVLLAGIGVLFSARLSVSGGVAVMLLGLAGIMALHYLLIWYAMVGGRGTAPVVARNSPPNAPSRLGGRPLSALALHFLWNRCRVTPRGVLAALVDLSARGCCSLSGDAGSGFIFSRAVSSGASVSGEEEALLAALPRKVSLKKSEAWTWSAARRVCERFLRKAYPWGWRWHVLPLLPPFAVTLFCCYAVCDWVGLSGREILILAAWCCIMTAVAILCWITLRLLRSDRLVYVRRGQKLLFVVIPLCGLLYFLSDAWIALLPPLHVALVEGMLLLPVFAGCHMGAPSSEVAALRREIAGLARYIRTGEGMDAAAAPGRMRELFQRLLPYAVALELETTWRRHFASVLPRGNGVVFQEQATGLDAADLGGTVFIAWDLVHALDSADASDTLFFGDGIDFEIPGDYSDNGSFGDCGGDSCDGGGGDGGGD